jgi:DNA-binding MarR family transcriptional regulator
LVDHDRAWRAFASAQAAVTQQIRADLAGSTDLTLGEIEVLDQLQNDDGIRMAELADRVFTSRSGLTRRIDRLEQKGLVVRTAVTEDRRGAAPTLTPYGAEVAHSVVPRYWASIARHFGDRLEPHADCVVDVLERFTDRSQ